MSLDVSRPSTTTCLPTHENNQLARVPVPWAPHMKAALMDRDPSTPDAPALEHEDRWPWNSLSRSTAGVLATLCVLTFLVLPAAVSWQQQQQRAGCHAQRPAVAAARGGANAAAAWRREDPDNATFAICVMMRVAADDPQWVDGRAEDVHEARTRQICHLAVQVTHHLYHTFRTQPCDLVQGPVCYWH